MGADIEAESGGTLTFSTSDVQLFVGFENFRERVTRDTYSVIYNRDRDLPVRRRNTDGDGPATFCVFDRIIDEVEQKGELIFDTGTFGATSSDFRAFIDNSVLGFLG